MTKEAKTGRKTMLAASSILMAVVVITLFRLHRQEGNDNNFAKHIFELDGGTHVIQFDRGVKGSRNTIWFGVTSSWPQGVPSQWEPLGSGARSIRWTATIDCKNREWTPYTHDTYFHVTGEGDKLGCLLMRPVKQGFSDRGWAMKRPVLEFVCGVST